jgi:tetratricopeptide (TPR) repeat protein
LKSAMGELFEEDLLQRAGLALTGGTACRQLSRFDDSIRLVEHALSLAQQFPKAETQAAYEIGARAHYQLGVVMHQRDQTQAALDHWQAALCSAEQADMPHLEAMSRGALAILLQSLGRLAEAATLRQTAITQSLALGDNYSAGYYLSHMGDLERLRGRFDSALHHLDEAYTLLTSVGDVWGLANASKKRAEVLVSMGKVTEAQTVIEDVLERLDSGSPIREYAEYLQVLAITQILQNQLAAADSTLRKAFQIGSVVERPRVLNKLTVTMSLALVAGDQLEDASAVLAELPRQTNDVFLNFDYWLASALVALGEHNPDEAARLCTQVTDQANEYGATLHAQAAAQILQMLPTPPPFSHFPHLLWIAQTPAK